MKFEKIALRVSLFALAVVSCFARLSGKRIEGRVAYNEPPENMFEAALISHPTGTFAPLECNANLDKVPCDKKFSSYFQIKDLSEQFIKFEKRLTIPCGMCIVMDQIDGVVDLIEGINIKGKLLIPDGIRLRMRLTSMLVQGELEIVSSKAIDGSPDVHLVWLSGRSPLAFVPENNTDACGGNRHACNLGKKPFVVAGGKVNIRGLPNENMPTWVPLYDVDESESEWPVHKVQYKRYQPLPGGCPEDGILIDHGVITTQTDGTSQAIWEEHDDGTTKVKWTGNSLHVSNRRHTETAASISLKDIRDCLSPSQTYLVSARVTLTEANSSGLTKCAKLGENCLTIARKHKIPHSSSHKAETVWTEHQSLQTKLGEAFTVSAEVHFGWKELSNHELNEVLDFAGPDESVDIEISDIMFFAPPPDAYSTAENVCKNMVPANGDAELFERSPFPFWSNDEAVNLEVAEEDYNHFFRVTGRDFAKHKNYGSRHRFHRLTPSELDGERASVGMTWTVPRDCIKRLSTYRIHADVRVHGQSPVVIELIILGTNFGGEAIGELLAKCPPSNGDWVTCDGEFIVPKKLASHSDHHQISIQTLGSVAADYDIDNLSFELVERPIDRLIIPETIKGAWAPGAQIMLTSHTSTWFPTQLTTITKVEDDIERGFVNVQLKDPIYRPITAKENPLYRTEVALMSRNIAFDGGSGAYFTVLHTPYVPQVIQGADFSTFGTAGERDRYPILFDNCGDSMGSFISKNTIRRSGQRCVVLHATNNVLVEGNIAHDTTGHCYALDSGAEVGNIFVNNLGAKTRAATHLMPQFGISGKETDDIPATFWITNPANSFEGNVASGSKGYGFWVSLAGKPRGPHAKDFYSVMPNRMPLSHFANNTAHSTFDSSLKVSGYHPQTPQSIVGFRAYLTPNNDTLEFSSTENLALSNPILDKPFRNLNRIPIQNASVVKLFGCDDAARFLDFDESEQDHTTSEFPTTPSASPSASVFNLQES